MIDYRHLYLLLKIKGKVIPLISVKVFFAKSREQHLHQIWKQNQFTIGDKLSWWRNWCKVHIKIGIASDVKYRVKRINESKLKSGKTEYFTVGLIELICIVAQMIFIKLTDVAILATSTLLIIAILYLVKQN